MIFRSKLLGKAIERHNRLSNWHPFFTIVPRSISPTKIAFFETIQRKGTYKKQASMHESFWSWKYKL